VLREPFVPRRNDRHDESVADFVIRRLNREFLDRAVDALVAGIYAGDPEKLSVRHALPRLYQLEQTYGSLIRGQVFGARDRERRGEVARNKAKMFSFDDGLQVLPDTLAGQLGDSVRLNCSVSKIARTAGGWNVSAGGDSDHSAVIYCGTAHRLAELAVLADGPALPPPTTVFSDVRYAPVASVVLGFRRSDIGHPLDGFGMLIPKIEDFKILGSIFSSSLFPDRAPADCVTITCYIGGERNPALALKSPEELVRIACDDLRILLGVTGAPVFTQVALYPKAIPQYNVGYDRFKLLMDQMEAKMPGLYFAGHYRDGVSLGDSIVSGRNIAERVSMNTDKHGST
jgi:protoporphyrinogen/coproporphyrinogen III oxidase